MKFVNQIATDGVKKPKKEDYEGHSYTKPQLIELLETIKDTNIELPVYLAIFLGLRRSEVIGLQWKNVDLEQRTIHIKTVRTTAGKNVVVKAPKTKMSRRSIFIPDDLLDSLIKQKNIQELQKKLLQEKYYETDYVCIRSNGKPCRVNLVTERFSSFLEKNGLPKIRFHDLRHTFASILYNHSGIDLKAISEVLGHSNVGTTSKIYTHRFDKTHKETVSAMSVALN